MIGNLKIWYSELWLYSRSTRFLRVSWISNNCKYFTFKKLVYICNWLVNRLLSDKPIRAGTTWVIPSFGSVRRHAWETKNVKKEHRCRLGPYSKQCIPRLPTQPPLANGRCRHLRCFSTGSYHWACTLWVLNIYLFFLLVMLPSLVPRLTTDSPVRVFPGVWKLLF